MFSQKILYASSIGKELLSFNNLYSLILIFFFLNDNKNLNQLSTLCSNNEAKVLKQMKQIEEVSKTFDEIESFKSFNVIRSIDN